MPRRLLYALMVIVALVAGWFWWSGRQPDVVDVDVASVARVDTLRASVTASGEIVATRYADLGSSVMGRLVSLRVREGDRVTAGQVLARIDPIQAQSAVASSAAALQALEAEAAGANNQVRAAHADITVATSRQTEAQRALQRARELASSGLLAQSELDAAVAAADTAVAQVAAATAALARAEQTRSAATQRVAQGRAERARVGDQLAKTEITAPIAGVVTRLDVEEGEMVVMGVQNQPGSILMTISDLSALDAEVKVAEADVLRLALENRATITLDALTGRTYTGRVVDIGASALPQIGTQAAAREFRVKVRLEGDVASLRPGLTCDTEILVAERRNVLAVPLQAVVERDGVSGLFVVDGGRAAFTPVTTGIIGGLTIEVTGVNEGASIVAGPFQVLRELPDGAAVRPAASR
ncbi:MAG: efflux RND transporter periplasmic adaptor subunit [Acidobacteria bacterium]|nr:efflux RND transporter periplasmic adaptor subunit [Acidobacteriota bacterium]